MEAVAVVGAGEPCAASAREARKLALRGDGVDGEERMLEDGAVDDVLVGNVAVRASGTSPRSVSSRCSRLR